MWFKNNQPWNGNKTSTIYFAVNIHDKIFKITRLIYADFKLRKKQTCSPPGQLTGRQENTEVRRLSRLCETLFQFQQVLRGTLELSDGTGQFACLVSTFSPLWPFDFYDYYTYSMTLNPLLPLYLANMTKT